MTRIMPNNIVRDAISDAGGPRVVGPACGRSYQAALKWFTQGSLPRTEWTGETQYAQVIENLTKGKYRKDELLSVRPKKKRKR